MTHTEIIQRLYDLAQKLNGSLRRSGSDWDTSHEASKELGTLGVYGRKYGLDDRWTKCAITGRDIISPNGLTVAKCVRLARVHGSGASSCWACNDSDWRTNTLTKDMDPVQWCDQFEDISAGVWWMHRDVFTANAAQP